MYPRDLCARITVIGWERYWAATRPIRILGLLNKHSFCKEKRNGLLNKHSFCKEKRNRMDDIGKVYLVLTIAVLLGSFVALWLISKKTPKGTVLGICVLLYILGSSIDPGKHRELHLLTGLFKMVGFFGGILGLIDLFRNRGKDSRDGAEPDTPPDHQ